MKRKRVIASIVFLVVVVLAVFLFFSVGITGSAIADGTRFPDSSARLSSPLRTISCTDSDGGVFSFIGGVVSINGVSTRTVSVRTGEDRGSYEVNDSIPTQRYSDKCKNVEVKKVVPVSVTTVDKKGKVTTRLVNKEVSTQVGEIVEYYCNGISARSVTFRCLNDRPCASGIACEAKLTLNVDSNPSGATVFIDGISKGITPIVVPNLSLRNYTIVLTKEGYLNYTSTKSISELYNSLTASLVKKPTECLELIPGQNKLDDKRIDLVFIGFNYSSVDAIVSLAKKITQTESTALFKTEPFKSNKDRFNLWYVNKVGSAKDMRLQSGGIRFGPEIDILSDVCTKKLGYYKDSLPFPFFSSRMFSVLLVNKMNGGSTFGGNDVGDVAYARGIGGERFVGLHGVLVPIPEEGKPIYSVGGEIPYGTESWKNVFTDRIRRIFLHEMAHALTQTVSYNIGSPGSSQFYQEFHYQSPVDNSIVKTSEWRNIGEEYGGLVGSTRHCYVASPTVANDPAKALEECRSSKNALFGDLIGNDCGRAGVIDCCTNDPLKISHGARSCESCPTCYADLRYDLEVSCYQSCGGDYPDSYRATYNSIMNTQPDIYSYGLSNERILRDTIKLLTGRASNSLSLSNYPICTNEIKEEGEECDLGKANGICPSRCSSRCTINDCSSYDPIRTQAGVIKPGAILSAGTTSARIAWIVSYGFSVQNNAPSVTCRYSTIAGTSYDQMTGELQVISGWRFADVPVEKDKSYAYYIRCRDALGNTNEDDLALQFSVAS